MATNELALELHTLAVLQRHLWEVEVRVADLELLLLSADRDRCAADLLSGSLQAMQQAIAILQRQRELVRERIGLLRDEQRRGRPDAVEA